MYKKVKAVQITSYVRITYTLRKANVIIERLSAVNQKTVASYCQDQMGATVRSKECDADQPSQTEQLANWISRVRSKKLICRRSRRRNLRIEAVLTSVLSKAEYELRNKQLRRIMKWQQMKQRLMGDMACKDGGHGDGGRKDGDFQDGGGREDGLGCENGHGGVYVTEQYNSWAGPLCKELSSFDTFMAQLNEIKAPLQR